MRIFKTLALAATLASLMSCAGLKMTLKNSSVQKPSNVALFYSVETKDNVPVPGLPAEAFKIYEDDKLISPYESKQRILNQELSVVHYTMLLMDLSGSITESGTLPALIQAATVFADKLSKNQNVAVFGFDGGPKLIPIVAPTTNMATVTAGLKRLETYKVADPSTNLNGAIVEAVSVVKGYMAKAPQPLRFGTLVIFTDGTDRAARVSEADMVKTLRESNLNAFAIGIGGELSPAELGKISTVGYKTATDLTQITAAFTDVAAWIEAASRKFYLLSYCSPARAGTHTLRLEVLSNDLAGSLTHTFDATGFGPGCNPDHKPSFKTGVIEMGQTAPIPESASAQLEAASPKAAPAPTPAATAEPASGKSLTE